MDNFTRKLESEKYYVEVLKTKNTITEISDYLTSFYMQKMRKLENWKRV